MLASVPAAAVITHAMTTDRSDAPIQDKAPGVARGFASGLVFVVAFSAENRKSTFTKIILGMMSSFTLAARDAVSVAEVIA